MDRSFLSRPEVIAASRDFVCVRLTTYEDESEAFFLKSLYVGRSGEVENTTFGLLSPDGRTPLSRLHRSPKQVFADAPTMAAAMAKVSAKYADRPAVGPGSPLPTVSDVRLALNVASGDNLPLVVLSAGDAAAAKALTEKVRPLAWDARFRGRFVFGVSTDVKELAPFAGPPTPGVLIVQPDTFGQKGTMFAAIPAAATADEIAAGLTKALAGHHAADKTFQSHVRAGQRAGVFWDTKTPVTDPEEARARERGRKK